MNERVVVDKDLFGKPVEMLRDRRGRAVYKKDKQNQSIVAMLVSRRWTQERIAGYLGCDPKTLRKYYSRELETGADLIEGMALEILLQKMTNGDRIATQKILDVVDNGRLEIAPPKPRAVERLGKKEELDAAAKTPMGSWSDDFGDVTH